MKKFYSTLALACAVCVSASAAVAPFARKTDVKNAKAIASVSLNEKQAIKKANTVKPKALSSVADVYGEYVLSGVWALDGGTEMYPSLIIEASSAGSNTVTIAGFPFSDADLLEATVDVAKSTFTIRGGQDAWFNQNYPDSYVKFGTNLYNANPEQEVVATIMEDGSIKFPEDVFLNFYIISESGSGYFMGWVDVTFEKLVPFEYKAEEWEDAGKAKFLDNNINIIMNEGYEVPEQEVTLQKNKTTEGLYLLVNPYKGAAWQNANMTPDKDGYMMFDISNPNCVLLNTKVPSGESIDIVEEGVPTEMYMYNNEAYEAEVLGNTPDEQVELVESIMDIDAGETIADYLSSFDPETGKVHIINGLFGIKGGMLDSYYWTNGEIEYEITIPVNGSGVENVAIDNSNAPVKYYNIQGMEIANPAQGELVIKKQGSKVQKFIVK